MIPVNEPLIGDRKIQYVMDCLKTGWISSAGKYIEEFEQKWAAYCSMKYGVAVSNGTTALQVAARCLGLKPGDKVIMPTFTIICCALTVVECGAVSVLVDSDPHTWCMDVGQVAAKITERTRAIMPVHIYGHPVDMDPLLDLAEKHGLVIIEDAVEFARRLRALEVETQPFFLGMHEQPFFLQRGLFQGERYPGAERIARQGLYLPSGLALTEVQLDQVCEAVRKVLA